MRVTNIDQNTVRPEVNLHKTTTNENNLAGERTIGHLINEENQKEKVNKEQLEKGVNVLNDTVEAFHKHLNFELHDESGRFIVQVVNLDNNEVIKEIPPEEMLDMFGRIKEMVGVLIDEKI